MTYLRAFLILSLFHSWTSHADVICAKNYAELDRTPALLSLKTLISDQKQNGYVNKTKGSYFFIQTHDSQFIITFYTTGLFDLYGIHREGTLVFCDRDGQLTAVGLDRTQNIYVAGERLEFGHRGARESFKRGPMPEKLASINGIDPLTLASF